MESGSPEFDVSGLLVWSGAMLTDATFAGGHWTVHTMGPRCPREIGTEGGPRAFRGWRLYCRADSPWRQGRARAAGPGNRVLARPEETRRRQRERSRGAGRLP
jgi:hypothetical protein